MRAALVALLLLASAALAAGETRTFALTQIARDGDGVLLTVASTNSAVVGVTLSLLDEGGVLLSPEQTRASWNAYDAQTLRFHVGNATSATLRIHYTRNQGPEATDEIVFQVPPRAEDEGDARLDVVDVRVSGPDEIAITLRSAGTRAAGPATATLRDASGAAMGAPASLAALAPGAEAAVAFRVPGSATNAVLVLTYQNRTHETAFQLPAREGAAARWIDVTEARIADGNATLRLRTAREADAGPVNLWLEEDGARIGEPLSRRLDRLGPEGAIVWFDVPSDTEAVTLVVESASRSESVPLRLSSGVGGSALKLETDLPSREAEPGSSVTYSLRLSNDGAEALVDLAASGLPAGYEARFSVDGAGVGSVLAPKSGSRSLALTVTVPESASRDAGASLPLRVVAQQDGVEIAGVDLTLTLRGKAKLELQGQNWFAAGSADGAQTLDVVVKNAGSAAIHDVKLDASRPAGWAVSFSPAAIATLAPGESAAVAITVTPAGDAAGGRYVLDVSAGTDEVSARPRSLSFEVSTPQGSSLPWILGAGIAGVLALVLIVKIRRR